MSSTVGRVRGGAFLFAPCADPAGVEEDVFGRDAAGTLAFVVEQRRRADQAAAHELRAVTHWADLHRVGAGELGAVDPGVWSSVGADRFAGSLGDPGCE